MSSRGWGVVFENSRASAALTEVFEADATWRAATPWTTYREGRTFQPPDPALGSFETRHPPERVSVESATVLLAPDNADDALEDRIDSADEQVLIQQVRIDSRENRLLDATLRAADRGLTVRIHLAGAWYVEEENVALVEWLNRRADAEGWDLEARVDDSDGYANVHTKGVIVDDTAVVGSLNWVETATDENREVLLALEGPEVAEYYAGVFEADFSNRDDRSLPAGVLVGVAVGAAGALFLAARIEFTGRDGMVTDWQW